MTYERAYDQSVVERTANPLGLVAKGSVWYLAATVDGKARTYRASRIRAVTILDTPVARPDGFDLATFWAESSAEFRAALPVHRIVLRIAPEAMSRVRLGWRFATVESEGKPDDDGWITCTIRADSDDIALECALTLGGLAEVIEPAELRDRALASARTLLGRLEGAAAR
jgi:predicted DNA-binding transcriptional regulator YafY